MNSYNCYFDASYNTEISRCAFIVFKNDRKFYEAFHDKRTVDSCSAEQYALFLLLDYIQNNLNYNRDKILIFGDAKSVIEQTIKNTTARYEKIHRKYWLLNIADNVHIKFIPRAENQLADRLSKIQPNKSSGYLKPINNVRLSDYIYEIEISLDKIIIPRYYSCPNRDKYMDCLRFYAKYHITDRDIIINSENCLLDGYIMYLVLKDIGIKTVKVKVVNIE